MATKAGQVNEFFNIEKFEKDKKIILDGMAEILAAAAKTSAANKGSGSVSGGGASQKSVNADLEKAAKLHQQLIQLETEQAKKEALLKEQIRQKNAQIKEEIGLDAKVVGAYQAASNELKKRIKDYKDATIGVKNLTKEMIAERDAIQKLDRNIKDLDKSMGQHQRNVGNYRDVWKSVSTAWVAGTAALAGVVSFMKSAIQGAIDDEKAERKLGFALNNNTKALREFLALKEKYMASTLFSEDDIYGALNFAAAMGRTTEQTDKMMVAAAGLANVAGIDLNTSMMNLNATYEGSLGKLGKFDSSLKDLTQEQLANGEAVDILRAKLGKFATAGVDTAAGAMDKFKKSFDDVKDAIGNTILAWLGFEKTIGVKKDAVSVKWQEYLNADKKGQEDLVKKWKEQEKIAASNQKAFIASGKESAGRTQSGVVADEMRQLISMATDFTALNTAFKEPKKEIKGTREEIVLTIEELQRMYAILRTMGIANGGTRKINPNDVITKVTPKSGAAEQRPLYGQPKGGGNLQEKYGTGAEGLVSPEDQMSAEAAKWNARVQVAADAMSKIDAIVAASYANRFAAIDEEARKDDEAKERELKNAAGNTAKQMEINKRYDAKEAEREKEKRRIQKEQAKYQRTSSLINATINTALGVTGSLAQGGVLGIILAAITLAAGIAEIAIIASQPLPSYRKGKKTGGPAEFAKVHPGEVIKYADGSMAQTPDTPETLAYLPAGATVIPHSEVLEMAGRAASWMPNYGVGSWQSERVENEIRGLHAGFRMLNKTVAEKQENYITITEAGINRVSKNGNVYTEWINERVMP